MKRAPLGGPLRLLGAALVLCWLLLSFVAWAQSETPAAQQAPDRGGFTAAPAQIEPGLRGVPTGKGLPVRVQVGLYFNELEDFDDNAGRFKATTDLRLVWQDPRLRYPADQALNGHLEFRGTAAKAELERIWSPPVRMVNREGEAAFEERRLRITPAGEVELMLRTRAEYRIAVDVGRFPFDHQSLGVEVAVDGYTRETVDLDFSWRDVDFSRLASGQTLDGWRTGLVSLERGQRMGWGGESAATVTAALDVRRNALQTIPTIFIPLFASLLIPFLATWMNRPERGEFAVDAFELANIVIGGLFAVIALGFAISSSYPLIGNSDNTVTRLIGLNYVALAVGLLITVVFYRYRLPSRWFGPHVQEQAFVYLTWAFPLTFVLIGLALVVVSAV